MPLALENTTDQAASALDDETTEEQASTANPLANTGRAQALADLILRVTQNNTLELDSNQFQDLADAYGKLQPLEQMQLRTTLMQAGVMWVSNLDDASQGFDEDDASAYEAYQATWNAAPQA